MVKYLGTDDSVNTCECCGKSPLKHTVALDFDGGVRFYGVICAGRALGTKTRTAGDVVAAVNSANKLNATKNKVDEMRQAGRNVVYGRFYINSRSIKTTLQIAEPSDLMVGQIYPPREVTQ